MPNGEKYFGQFSNGLRHGNATLRDAAGNVLYEGRWKNNKKHGKGKFYYHNGVYDGRFANDKRHGHGEYTFTDGATYKGEWQHQKMHGIGKFTYPNGDVYEGDFGICT